MRLQELKFDQVMNGPICNTLACYGACGSNRDCMVRCCFVSSNYNDELSYLSWSGFLPILCYEPAVPFSCIMSRTHEQFCVAEIDKYAADNLHTLDNVKRSVSTQNCSCFLD